MQRVRGGDCQGWWRFAVPGQDVQDDARRMDVVGQRLGTGGFDGIDPIRQHRAQDLDHLPIAAGLALQLALHTPDGDRQVPLLERRPVAQSTRFAGENRYVMQGVVDGVVAPEERAHGCRRSDHPASIPVDLRRL